MFQTLSFSKSWSMLLSCLCFFLLLPGFAHATIDKGDTAWILTATALVLFTALPGLALFYARLVQPKKVVSVLMHHFALVCLCSVLWVAVGYSIAFSDGSAWFGSLNNIFMSNINISSESGTITESLYAAFQMTFAIITPALIIGAYAERIKFSVVIIFSGIWLVWI